MKHSFNKKASVLAGLTLIAAGSAILTASPVNAYGWKWKCKKYPQYYQHSEIEQSCSQEVPCGGYCFRKTIGRLGECEKGGWLDTCKQKVDGQASYKYDSAECYDQGAGWGVARCTCELPQGDPKTGYSLGRPNGTKGNVLDCD